MLSGYVELVLLDIYRQLLAVTELFALLFILLDPFYIFPVSAFSS